MEPQGYITHVAFLIGDKVISLPKPARHHLLFKEALEHGIIRPYREVQGFLSENGVFLDRKNGAKYALKIGQIKKLKFGPNYLYSEDLW